VVEWEYTDKTSLNFSSELNLEAECCNTYEFKPEIDQGLQDVFL
jgi:hypothetical protein